MTREGGVHNLLRERIFSIETTRIVQAVPVWWDDRSLGPYSTFRDST